MSPEVFKYEPYSFKSDIWALGCILFELCTLNHPFKGDSLNELARSIINGRHAPLPRRLTRNMRILIKDMLSIDPKKRPDIYQILNRPWVRERTVNYMIQTLNLDCNPATFESKLETVEDRRDYQMSLKE